MSQTDRQTDGRHVIARPHFALKYIAWKNNSHTHLYSAVHFSGVALLQITLVPKHKILETDAVVFLQDGKALKDGYTRMLDNLYHILHRVNCTITYAVHHILHGANYVITQIPHTALS